MLSKGTAVSWRFKGGLKAAPPKLSPHRANEPLQTSPKLGEATRRECSGI